MDRTLNGLSASPGIAVGHVRLLRWELPDVPHAIVPDEAVPAELDRFHHALAQGHDRLELVRQRAERRAGKEEAAIFETQQLILDDPDMRANVESLIRHNLGAERAFHQHMSDWRQRFERHADAYFRERVGDILDVEIRVLSLLLGLEDHDPVMATKGDDAILVAHDLSPSLTIQLDRQAILGIATDAGTRTSHVAILARSLGLPAVVGLRDATSRLAGGELVILDGTAGTLNVNPTPAEVEVYRERAMLEVAETAELALLATAEPVTLDGVRITLLANVDLPEEAENASRSGAEGVGLMRTEFLVVGRAAMPDEDEQYEEYRRVVECFGGQRVIIRTFDIGGDKLPVGGFPHEANPFLGWRAIRMCLDQPELFKTQLRACLRAALHGDVQIMLPLIVTVEEVRAARALLVEAAGELAERGTPHRADVPLGVMVETPAAAICADTMASEVDFFSIGTNDLTQYTLAVDRGNTNLAGRFTQLHPSVLRLIRRTVDVARDNNLNVSVCGEMGSQPLPIFALLGLGVHTLSVAARAIPLVKRLVRGIRLSEAVEAADAALQVGTAAEAEVILLQRLRAALGDDPYVLHGL
ncbi:MAG: phosphoenolpyruvate--protein phosphotransferase [Gemmatimonadota bacterium]|nr:phosphoenolpyruvate--protein phosphotransferase [Gemmatimonadota bacterium]